MAARHLVVRGFVQGVGFRYAFCAEARRLGLRGWVRNRTDGSVEAVAAGDDAALQALERWAHHGPSAARVGRVEATPLSEDALAMLLPAVGDDFTQEASA